MPSPDTLATIVLAAATLLAVLAICLTDPGAGLDWIARRRRARAYHRAGKARHARRDEAEPAALATIPDALKARTA